MSATLKYVQKYVLRCKKLPKFSCYKFSVLNLQCSSLGNNFLVNYFISQKMFCSAFINNPQRKQTRVFDHNFMFFRRNPAYKDTVVIVGKDFLFNRITEENITECNILKLSKEQVKDLSTLQIKYIMTVLANYCDVSPELLVWLDEECALRAHHLPLNLAFYLLDAWFLVSKEDAFRNNYFKELLAVLETNVNSLSKNNIVQILYVFGLAKSAPNQIIQKIEMQLEVFSDHISAEEWAVICSGIFKTRKKINSKKLLNKICEMTSQNLLQISRFHLISILKALRHSNYYDKQLWYLLEDYINNKYQSFNFVECTNFLAAFANVQLYSKKVFACLETHGISLLQNELSKITQKEFKLNIHPSLQSRTKDLTRFLWAISSIGHIPISSHFLKVTVALLHKKWNNSVKNLHFIIDSFQSLILMEHYPLDLISELLKPHFASHLLTLNRQKPFNQLYFISGSLKIECKNYSQYGKLEKYGKPITKSIYNEIVKRNGFQELLSLLKLIYDTTHFKCCYQLPHIAIAGIIISLKNVLSLEDCITGNLLSVYNKSQIPHEVALHSKLSSTSNVVCIEILDTSVCIQHAAIPTGLMKAKLRQLKKLNYKVVTFTPDDIKEFSLLSLEEVKLKIDAFLLS